MKLRPPTEVNGQLVVDVRWLKWMNQQKAIINSTPLKDILFTRGNQELEIDPDNIEAFEYVGLSNVNFILDDFYKGGWDD